MGNSRMNLNEVHENHGTSGRLGLEQKGEREHDATWFSELWNCVCSVNVD